MNLSKRRGASDLTWVIGIVIVSIIIIVVIATAIGEQFTTGTVTGVIRTWQAAGDIQGFSNGNAGMVTYENITVASHGYTFTALVTCNYYPVGATNFPVEIDSASWWHGFSIHTNGYFLQTGCNPDDVG